MLIWDWWDFLSFEMELTQTHCWVSYLCRLWILHIRRQKIPYLGWHFNFLSICHPADNYSMSTQFNYYRGFGLSNSRSYWFSSFLLQSYLQQPRPSPPIDSLDCNELCKYVSNFEKQKTLARHANPRRFGPGLANRYPLLNSGLINFWQFPNLTYCHPQFHSRCMSSWSGLNFFLFFWHF